MYYDPKTQGVIAFVIGWILTAFGWVAVRPGGRMGKWLFVFAAAGPMLVLISTAVMSLPAELLYQPVRYKKGKPVYDVRQFELYTELHVALFAAGFVLGLVYVALLYWGR